MLYLGLLGALNCKPHHEKACFSRMHATNKGADRVALSRSFNNASLRRPVGLEKPTDSLSRESATKPI